MNPAIEQVTLNKIRLAARAHIDPDTLLDQNFDVMVDAYTQSLVLQLSGAVLGKEYEPLAFQWPRDWWEAVKERFAPQWLLARWPVIYRKERVEFREIYPDFKPALPQSERQHRFVIARQNFGWEGP
jgi:hypothetical protein